MLNISHFSNDCIGHVSQLELSLFIVFLGCAIADSPQTVLCIYIVLVGRKMRFGEMTVSEPTFGKAIFG